jgi:hypothetical protein
MSIGGSKSSNKSQSTQTYDPQVRAAQQANLAQANGLLAGYQPYSGELTAGFNPTQMTYFDQATNAANSRVGADAINSATQGTQALAGYNPYQVSAQTLANTDLSPYMNPYTQDVINTSLANINHDQAVSNQGINSQATQQGAFGGDRSAVANALNDESYIRNKMSTIAGLNSSNFNQAQQAAGYDIGNNLQGQLANQQAGLAGAQFRLGANNQLAQLGNQQQQNLFNSLGLLASVGNQQQANQQLADNNNAANYQNTLNNRMSLQQIINQALGLSGSGVLGNSSSKGGSTSFSFSPSSGG